MSTRERQQPPIMPSSERTKTKMQRRKHMQTRERQPLNEIIQTDRRRQAGKQAERERKQAYRLNDKNAIFMPTRERQQPPIMPSFRTNENEKTCRRERDNHK